ncbi:MAG TPA: branched-chain amino acid transaminase [Chloroflexia bacterium]|nr:branched-chain amino acid transaminase [Chloroflexia bacterium]
MAKTIYSYLNGEIIPLADAKISILTHAFNYGTACFEGIRGYWNEEDKQLYLFRLREHMERMTGSARILMLKLPGNVDTLCTIARDLVKYNEFHEDVYMRPTAYISSEVIGVKLNGLESGFCIYVQPFGAYIDIENGLKVGVSSWKRTDDNMIPARAKIAGAYVNSAFAKSEALMNGFDEAIMLTNEGHVSEGSAENLFMLTGNKLVTPAVMENVLVGITRHTVMTLARDEFGLEIVERTIDRTELYTCDELFLCGTGAQIAPVSEVDHRPVGTGKVGEFTARLQQLYFDVVRGKVDKYKEWCTPVY